MLEVIRRLGIFPHTCVLELTLRCNFRCRHCGSHAGQPRPEELSTEEWLRICDELVELHCERVTLSGGEPTMHPDWALIGKSLADRGVCVNVVSNGSLWTDEVTRQAMAAGLNNVGFSLDGLAATHDEWRAFPGSFERIMAALASCRRHHFRSSVVTVLNRRNIAELRELRALLAERGVRWWQCQLGTPSGELRQHPEWLLNAEDLLEVVPLLAELRAMPGRPHLVLTDNVGYYGKYEAAIRKSPTSWGFWMGCRAGLQTIGIESNGNVKGCLSLPSERHGRRSFVEGNLRTHSLSEIWHREGGFADTREFGEQDLGGFCRECNYRDVCRGGCLWMSYACSGDPRDNRFCFYRQAVEAEAWELLDEADIPAAQALRERTRTR